MPDLTEGRGPARATASLLAARLSANVAFFVAVLMIARALGPANRGAFAFVSVSGLIVGNLAPLGIGPALTVLAAQHPGRRRELAGTGLAWAALTGVAGGLLLLVAGYALRSYLPDSVDTFALACAAAAVAAVATASMAMAVLQGASLFHRYALVTATTPWIYVAILFIARVAGDLDLHTAIGAWMLGWLMAASGGLLVTALSIGLGPPRLATIRESRGFGARAWLGTLSLVLNARIDQVLMGFLATEAALGIYAVAVNVSEVLLYLPAIVGAVLLPTIAGGAPERTTSTTLAAARQLLLFTGLSIVVAAVLAPPLIPLVFGQPYAGAVRPFLLLLPGALGYALLVTFASALTASGQPGRASAAWLVTLGVGVSADILLIPAYGAAGAAAAATIAFIAAGASAVLAFHRWRAFALAALVPRGADARGLVAGARAVLGRRRGDSLRLRSAPAGVIKAMLVAAQAAAWRLRRRDTPDGLRILFYHRISDDRDQLAVSVGRFRRQMEAIARSGLPVVDLATIAPDAPPQRAIALTFDDGYLDFAENALPVLQQHGFPATVFVCPAHVSGDVQLSWYGRDRQPPLLDWAQMRAIEASACVRFEPHSMTHRDLTLLADEDARREIEESRDAVARELGRDAFAFCYPGGYAGDREAALAREAGFALGLTCEPGVNVPGTEPMLLRRTPVDRYDGGWLFRARLAGATDVGVPLRSPRSSPERAAP
jgi:O-antigen/teichoic acid export membrane protein/peptidoglycan/xylan/chitin deacetylase (PgdA/CDA1 family)